MTVDEFKQFLNSLTVYDIGYALLFYLNTDKETRDAYLPENGFKQILLAYFNKIVWEWPVDGSVNTDAEKIEQYNSRLNYMLEDHYNKDLAGYIFNTLRNTWDIRSAYYSVIDFIERTVFLQKCNDVLIHKVTIEEIEYFTNNNHRVNIGSTITVKSVC